MSTHPSDPMAGIPPGRGIVTDVEDEATVVDISEYRASRYERNSRSLPHLGDDPDWTPATFDLPSPIPDDTPKRWFHRLRR
jgi:hypothetical protein